LTFPPNKVLSFEDMSEKKRTINPFTDPQIAIGYETWYQTIGKQIDLQEKTLLMWLLNKFPDVDTILEIGCGTGHFARWLGEQGLWTMGLDISWPMLLESRVRCDPHYVRGDALNLPFTNNAFGLVVLITTLEFLPSPGQAFVEAWRVARRGLILGAINRNSLLGRQYRNQGGRVWDAAHFFTPQELRKLIIKSVGKQVVIDWRTILWPFYSGALPLPWGGFLGMLVRHI
jgi:ubiquinone/menaquinone biosynthesis C-methylase UbiE